MSDTGVQARRSAVYLLDMILGEERLMSELLAAGVLDKLPPDDRARAQRLAMDTLRGMERADRMLQKHLSKYPPLTVRNVLRVGTVELGQGGAAHGVVNAMVELVATHNKLGHLKGLTNAVLRKIAADGPEAWAALRSPRLPKWLRAPLSEAWGPEAIAGIESSHFAGAPLDLTAKKDPEALAVAVGGVVLPTGSVRVADAGQVTMMPGFAEGDWWVQDAAAALPVKILAPQKGEVVLDLCAAPGGKTMQLAAAGEIEGEFDAILLDAPCSATGTIRRHPDLPYAKDGSEFADLIELQADLIDHAWRSLKPGGRLIFCTCSLLPDEGEVQVDEALEWHPDMRVDKDAVLVAGVDPSWVTTEGGLRLRPDYWSDLGGMDGFYIASLRKSV